MKCYHGVTDGDIDGTPEVPFYCAHSRELAESYAEGGTVLAYEVTPRNPLVLDTPTRFWDAWTASGASDVDGRFHPAQTSVFCSWASAQGHDAIVIPESAFEGEDGYELVAGTVGEPQTIVLDAAILRRVE